MAAEGFAFVHGAEMRALLGPMPDWPAFAASWDDLGLDTYMADGGRYRKRRHAAFGARSGEPIHRKPHQPHYQSRDYNPLNGGIARWFDPVLPEIATGASMTTILATCRALFERLAPTRDWHIEVHQFRIEARSGAAGQPTPEGMHRDGVDYVLVLLIGRRNIQSGVTSIQAHGRAEPRQLHAGRAVRCGVGGRPSRDAWRDRGRADRSGAAGVPRRAGRDISSRGRPLSGVFAVIRSHGPAWDHAHAMEEQHDWVGHAAFMDALHAAGFLALVGPLEGTRDVLLIARADTVEQIEARLSTDPWTRSNLLSLTSVLPWTIRLGSVD